MNKTNLGEKYLKRDMTLAMHYFFGIKTWETCMHKIAFQLN